MDVSSGLDPSIFYFISLLEHVSLLIYILHDQQGYGILIWREIVMDRLQRLEGNDRR